MLIFLLFSLLVPYPRECSTVLPIPESLARFPVIAQAGAFALPDPLSSGSLSGSQAPYLFATGVITTVKV